MLGDATGKYSSCAPEELQFKGLSASLLQSDASPTVFKTKLPGRLTNESTGLQAKMFLGKVNPLGKPKHPKGKSNQQKSPYASCVTRKRELAGFLHLIRSPLSS